MFAKKIVLLAVSVILHRAYVDVAAEHGDDFGSEKILMSGLRISGYDRE
jgi:hypothetical protein